MGLVFILKVGIHILFLLDSVFIVHFELFCFLEFGENKIILGKKVLCSVLESYLSSFYLLAF